jgi:hypothetical protein
MDSYTGKRGAFFVGNCTFHLLLSEHSATAKQQEYYLYQYFF